MIIKNCITCVALSCTLLFSSCSAFGGRTMIFDDSGRKADARLEQIIESLECKDSDSLKAMFSKNALYAATSFDDSIDYVFSLYQGKLSEWKRTSFTAPTRIESGDKSVQLQSIYTVTTDENKYRFFVCEYSQDSFDPGNVGLNTLRIIKAEDEETQFTFSEDMTTPGIYMPE